MRFGRPPITASQLRGLATQLINLMTRYESPQDLNLIRQKVYSEPVRALQELAKMIQNLRVEDIREERGE